jgi:hypothetical protein
LTRQEQHPGLRLTLDPPPDGLHVPISGEEALQVAWSEDQPDSAPTSTEADLALLSDAGHAGAPVWVVRYSGVCVPVGGPPDPEASPGTPHQPHCGSEWDVLIDARAGTFIIGFSDHDDGETPGQ